MYCCCFSNAEITQRLRENRGILSWVSLVYTRPPVAFSFNVTAMGMTLSWTNVQLKSRKNLNWFCSDNPGVFCCKVTHQQNFISKFSFCSFSPSVGLGWCIPQHIQLFWVDYDLGMRRPFCFLPRDPDGWQSHGYRQGNGGKAKGLGWSEWNSSVHPILPPAPQARLG